MSTCKQVRIHPATTGIIRPEGGVLKLEYGCMTDVRAEAIAQTLRASSVAVHSASLRSNGLSDRGARYLLDAFPEGVRIVDVSQNDLGHGRENWCEALCRLARLTSLNVSDSQLGDAVCRSLCEALISCKHLNSLNVSANNINYGASELGGLLRGHRALQEFDMHWNHCTGTGAHELMRGLFDNGMDGGALHNVNLSWNPLGKVGGEATCKQLAQVFSDGNTLRHIDISKCELNYTVSQILADGLKDNTTILGIHISGNEARVDTRGYIVPVPPTVDDNMKQVPIGPDAPTSSSCPRVDTRTFISRLRAEPQDNIEDDRCPRVCCPHVWQGEPAQTQNVPQKAPGPDIERSVSVHQPSNSCWLCERWVETRIAYTPGVSGPDTGSDVWVFTAVDNFEQPTKLRRSQGGELMAYVVSPAGPLHFVFQAGTHVVVSQTSSVLYGEKPKSQPPIAGKMRALVRTIRRLKLPGEPEHVESADPCESDGDLDASFDDGHRHKHKDPFVVEVRDVNAIQVPKAPRDDDLVFRAAGPRKLLLDPQGDFPPTDWAVDRSLFAPYVEALERQSFCSKCFDADWQASRLPMLVDDHNDRVRMKEVLRANYAEIKVMFASLCSVDYGLLAEDPDDRAGQQLNFGIGMHEFTHMLLVHNLLHAEDMRLEEADAQFLIAADLTKQASKSIEEWQPSAEDGHLVLRHGFFELLVRLAFARFARHLLFKVDDQSGGDRRRRSRKSAHYAVDRLITNHIVYPYPPMVHNYNSLQWRVDVLHTEVVEKVYRRHLTSTVEPLFKAYSRHDVRNPQSSRRFLRPEDWFELLDVLDMFPCCGEKTEMNTWDRVWIWQLSCMSHADELSSTSHLELTFVEFLEALGRLLALSLARPQAAEASVEDGGALAPAAAFCSYNEVVMEPETFAQQLDRFLSQPSVQQAITNAAPRRPLS